MSNAPALSLPPAGPVGYTVAAATVSEPMRFVMNAPAHVSSTIPFDAARLDKLMDAAGMDVLIATSKHNVQYLLGGHRAFFFDYMDAMGLSTVAELVA